MFNKWRNDLFFRVEIELVLFLLYKNGLRIILRIYQK